jgi:hypothetical protein
MWVMLIICIFFNNIIENRGLLFYVTFEEKMWYNLFLQ